MQRRTWRVALAVLLSGGIALSMVVGTTFVTFGQEKGSAVPEIPGITVDDINTNGCVDCHRKVSEDSDYRISTYIKELAEEGNHPDVTAMINTVPDDCLVCHGETTAEGMGTDPLAPILHRMHLVGMGENDFITGSQGQCTHCHALNKDTGQMRTKAGGES